MKLILAAYAKNGILDEQRYGSAALAAGLRRMLPLPGFGLPGKPASPLKIDQYRAPSSRFALAIFSNDADDVLSGPDTPLLSTLGPHVFAWAGFFHESGICDPKGLLSRLVKAVDTRPILAELGGAAALLHYDSERHVLRYATSLTGMPQLFVGETADAVIVGSRPDQVALVTAADGRLAYNLTGMVSFCLTDFFNTHHQPFRGVRLVEPNRCGTIAERRIEELEIDDTIRRWGTSGDVPTEADFDDLTEAFLNALRFFTERRSALKLGLSGGKDSRLVAAGLKRLGANFYVNTGGWETNTDFIVGDRVGQLLGVPQHLSRLRDGPQNDLVALRFKQDILQGIVRMAAQRLSRPATPRNIKTDPVWRGSIPRGPIYNLSGTYGEILRGGGASVDRPYLASLPKGEITSEAIEAQIRKIMCGNLDLFHPDLAEGHKEAVEQWIERYRTPEQPLALLEKYDFIVNQFRRAAPVLYLGLGNGGEYMPLADAQLLRAVGRFEAKARTEHVACFEIMRRCVPELERMPLADTRWGFEKEGPRPGDEEGYKEREPLKFDHTSKAYVYTYYALPTDMRGFIEEEFAGPLGDAVWQVVRREELQRIMRSPDFLAEATSYWMLNIYGAGLILNNEWLDFMALDKEPDDAIEVRFDHPWARFHNWSFYSLDTLYKNFSPGEWESPTAACRRFIGDFVGMARKNAGLIGIPEHKWQAEWRRLELDLFGRRLAFADLLDEAGLAEKVPEPETGNPWEPIDGFRGAVYDAFRFDQPTQSRAGEYKPNRIASMFRRAAGTKETSRAS